ncbi:MAG: hypothetical protein U0746_10205 [Gemmataceae bacterium]
MQAFLERTGESVTLSPRPFAAGGEGDLREVQGEPARVVKIYHANFRTPGREMKLGLQCRLPSPDRRVVWPLGRVYDRPGGQFLGIEMKRVPGRRVTLDEILTAASRRHQKVSLTFVDRLRVVAELADIVLAIFRSPNLVIGDFNPGNWLVEIAPDGRLPQQIDVAAIDTDSYQFTARDPRTGRATTYTTDVGVAAYLAAELQGQNLRGVTRTREEDLFALACIVWTLVKAAHPFTAKNIARGRRPQSLGEWIKQGWFPHAPVSPLPAGWVPVDDGLPFHSLPAKIRELANRTFRDGHATPTARATADEWRDALTQWADAIERRALQGNWLTGTFTTTDTYRAIRPYLRSASRNIDAARAWLLACRPHEKLRAWAARPDVRRKAAGTAIILAGLTVVPFIRLRTSAPEVRHADTATHTDRPRLRPAAPGEFDWKDAPHEWRTLGESRGEAPR